MILRVFLNFTDQGIVRHSACEGTVYLHILFNIVNIFSNRTQLPLVRIFVGAGHAQSDSPVFSVGDRDLGMVAVALSWLLEVPERA
jgi:hypothetical protein